MTTRFDSKFGELKTEGRAALVTFVTAGDPDYKTSLKILAGLPKAGADVIELGMPFTDPMADGPAIQAADLRALKAGATMKTTLALAQGFPQGRRHHADGADGLRQPDLCVWRRQFPKDAKAAGADGMIVVDLPPEEDNELCLPALAAGLDFIRLTTPTTDDARAPAVFKTPAASSIMSRCSA